MKQIKQNVFALFLDLLKVKYTKEFTGKLFAEHPHNNNLYGLSSLLSMYGVENAALKLEKNVSTLVEMDTPFLAYAGNDFSLVYELTSSEVSFYWQEQDITVPMEEFLSLWSGVVLIAEVDEKSKEPNYLINRKRELFYTAEKSLLWISIISVLLLVLFQAEDYKYMGWVPTFLINVVVFIYVIYCF